MLCFGTLSVNMRARIASQMLPGWRAALSTHNEELTKIISIGGRYKRLRALPLQRAVAVVEELRTQGVAALHDEIAQLWSRFAAMDFCTGGQVQDGAVSDDDAVDM
jgi:hypothetical protein